MTIIEQTEGHYDVLEVPFGKVYRWCPKRLTVECGCSERLTFTASSTATCHRCGAGYTLALREEVAAGRSVDEILHPWRYAKDREDAEELPF